MPRLLAEPAARCGACHDTRCSGAYEPMRCDALAPLYDLERTPVVRSSLKGDAGDPDEDFICITDTTPAELWARADFDTQADILEMFGLSIIGMDMLDAMDLVAECLSHATQAQHAAAMTALGVGVAA